VLAVVQPDPEHLPGSGDGRAESLGPERRAVLISGGRRPGGEGVPFVVDGLRVSAELAAAVLLHVVGDLVSGVAGHDDEPAVQVGDAHVMLQIDEGTKRKAGVRREG
jgi:hypothetical protein